MKKVSIDPKYLEIRLLSKDDDLSSFSCGDDTLDDWLKIDAVRYQNSRITKVYIAKYKNELAGYIALFADSLRIEPSDRRKLQLRNGDPQNIPALKIGRLATSSSFREKHRGMGETLIQFAFDNAVEMNEMVGIRLLIVDAYPDAISFYDKMEFVRAKVKNSDPNAEPGDKNRKTNTLMYLDVMGKRLPRWAFPHLIGNVLGNFEKSTPDWLEDAILWIVEGSLYSLKHYIEDPLDAAVTWDDPFAEIQRDVDYNAEEQTISYGSFSDEERTNKELLVKKLASVTFETIIVTAFRELTGLGHPLIVGNFPADKFDFDMYLKPINAQCTLCFNGTTTENQEYSGEVVMAICPLTIDADKKRAYIPVKMGLLFSDATGHPRSWSATDKESFWNDLFEAFKHEGGDFEEHRDDAKLDSSV